MAAIFVRSSCAGELDRGAEDGAAATSAGAERVRRFARVTLVDRHRVEGDTEMLGDELRGGGLDALSVRSRSEVHVDTAARLDADVGRLGGVGPHRGLRLDVEPDADPEQPSRLELLLLLAAESVVVDHRGGLLQRLRRRHMVERQTDGQEVRELVALDDVAAPELERVDAHGAREPVDRLFAADRSRSATGPGTAHASRCW